MAAAIPDVGAADRARAAGAGSASATSTSRTGPGSNLGPASILLAEHEPEVAEMSARYLRRDGLRVRLVTAPELALAELSSGPDAAAVLDLTMPGLDPRRLRRALRIPVILLVAGPRPRGLGPAATRRWLGRPFSPRQLVTLVREVLPEKPTSAGPRSAGSGSVGSGSGTGRLRLDGASRTALADGKRVPLTATEFAMLAAMADRPGRVFSRRQLLAAAGRQAAGDRAADVYIAQLRAKIGMAGQIRTARGAGYAMDPLQGGQ
jgi:DNA-binding response OmpR family regulator